MKHFDRVIDFLNRLKEVDVWGNKTEERSADEKEYLDRIPTQNPYGLLGMIFGGVAFAFGPEYGIISVIALAFCIVTLFTFDREKEDNPWPFYVGIALSIIGLTMFIMGEVHELIV
ncbi:cell division protein FtsK [Sporosarcina cascadiensis]|uniref:cell division protein FtsK n=1 Tax=Sporosarcina cascadiensis TaxID=2660747 RepID=UPI00129B613A|nr:cell division protein FtsK [Sporosarcina cascadiensis]